MPKLVKIDPGVGLYRDPRSGIYYFRKFVTGFGDKCESTGETNLYKAKKRCAQILAEWLGTTASGPVVLFETVESEVREIYRTKAPKTCESYEHHVDKYLLPFFKDTGLHQIGPLWQRYKAHCRRLTPTRKLRHDRKHLIYILRYACDQELLDKVPKLELDAFDKNTDAGREFTNSELQRLFKGVQKNTNLALLVELQLKTGARRGETRQLKWSYFDWKRRMIQVPAEICKTRYGRTYPIPKDLIDRLKARRAASPSEYVFPHRRRPDEPMTAGDKTWQRVKKAAGIKGKQHWLRHTAATRFVRSGVAGDVVQKALGMSEKVMKRVYLHVDESDLRRMASVVSESLGKRGEE